MTLADFSVDAVDVLIAVGILAGIVVILHFLPRR